MNPEPNVHDQAKDADDVAQQDSTDQQLTEQALVEEVSIDGMCGVY